MDMVRVQVLASDGEEAKKNSLIEKIESIGYLNREDPIDDSRSDLVDAFEGDFSDVVLIFEHFNGNGYASCQEILDHYPNKSALMIKSDNTKINIREVVQSGASDIIPFGIDVQSLTDIIYTTYKNNLKKQEVLKSEDERFVEGGKVYTVFSASGGSGKTFVATNIATTLAKDKSKRVVLVDLDFDYGGIDLAMNLNPRTSITNVIEDIQHLDSELMESYLTTHSSGVHVLSGDSNPNVDTYIGSDQVEKIISVLKWSYDYVVIDMPGRFMEAINPAFTLASTVFLVTTPEILTLRNTRSAMRVFEELNYPLEKVKVVLNKVAFGGISRKDIEKTIEKSVFEEIPEDVARVRKSQNEGVPYVISNPRRPITKSIKRLVNSAILRIK